MLILFQVVIYLVLVLVINNNPDFKPSVYDHSWHICSFLYTYNLLSNRVSSDYLYMSKTSYDYKSVEYLTEGESLHIQTLSILTHQACRNQHTTLFLSS